MTLSASMLAKAIEATERMYRSEIAMCNALDAYNRAREQLEDERARLLIEKGINGRNEHEREAELRQKTKHLLERVSHTRKAYQFAKTEWHYARQLAEIWTLAGYLGKRETEEHREGARV